MKEKRDFRNCRNCKHQNADVMKQPCKHCSPTLKNRWSPKVLKINAVSER